MRVKKKNDLVDAQTSFLIDWNIALYYEFGGRGALISEGLSAAQIKSNGLLIFALSKLCCEAIDQKIGRVDEWKMLLLASASTSDEFATEDMLPSWLHLVELMLRNGEDFLVLRLYQAFLNFPEFMPDLSSRIIQLNLKRNEEVTRKSFLAEITRRRS